MRDAIHMARHQRRRCVASTAALAMTAMVATAIGPLAGCYEHVTRAGVTSTEVRTKHEPNVDEEGPSWLNELMWGEPPKGEDPVKYYRRKNSFGLQE